MTSVLVTEGDTEMIASAQRMGPSRPEVTRGSGGRVSGVGEAESRYKHLGD